MKRLAKLKPLLGLLIIVLAGGLLYYWESTGREQLMTTKAFSTNCSIAQGTVITEDMIEVSSYMSDNIAEGAILEPKKDEIVGKVAKTDIAKGTQLNRKMVQEEELIDSGLSSFVIEEEWIAHRSSSLRGGDHIKLYTSNGGILIGEYMLTYVLNNEDKIVSEEDGRRGNDAFARGNGTGYISKLEIATTIEEYKRILEYVNSGEFTLNKLIVVQVN